MGRAKGADRRANGVDKRAGDGYASGRARGWSNGPAGERVDGSAGGRRAGGGRAGGSTDSRRRIAFRCGLNDYG